MSADQNADRDVGPLVPHTAQELDDEVDFTDLNQIEDGCSKNVYNTDASWIVDAVCAIGRELKMIRVALAERNQLLYECNEMARRAERRGQIGVEMRVALDAYRANPKPEHATEFVEKLLKSIEVDS
jgi:hypothetical protein